MTALSRPRRLSAPPVAALFQLFRYTFGVATRSAVAERRIRSLYAPFETRADVATAVPFRLEVRRTDESRRWEAYLGDQLLVSRPSLGAALYGLEVEICLRVIASRPDLIMLHGATVLAAGGAAFLSGPSGAGKSTLALALAARGYRIGGDDVALLEPCTGVIQPLPHCFHLDARSRRLLRREGLPMPAEAIRHNFLTATDLGMGAAIGAPIRLVLMLQGRGRHPDLTLSPQAEMAVRLLEETGWGTHSAHEVLRSLSRLAGDAACYYLRRGRLSATADVVTALLGPP